MHEIPRDSYASPPRGEDTEQPPDSVAESSPAVMQEALRSGLEERSDSLETILEEADDDPEECNQDIDRRPTALEKVPKITYLGAAATDEGKGIITEGLKGEIERISNVPEVTEKYEDRISATKKGILELGANEGVDVSERLGDAADVHIYHRRYTTLIGRRLDLSPQATGINTPDGIAMIEDKDPVRLYSNLKRGMFTGDSDQLDGLIPIIGQDGLDVLKKVSPYSAKSISEVIDTLGYKNVVPSSGRKVAPANLLQWLPRSQYLH